MKRKKLLALFGISSGLLVATALSYAQNKTEEMTVKGFVNEVGKLEISDANLSRLKLPPGFRLNVFAELQNARWFAVADDGTVYVSQREPGTLTMLKDTDGDGIADIQKIVAEKKDLHGVALHDNKLYFVTIHEVYMCDRNADGSLGEPKPIITDLPDAGQHANRTIAFGDDGMMYLSVGSTTNVAYERNPENATILRANADGSHRIIFASGLRNTIGFGWHPTTKRLFGFDHGIDWLGNDEPEEEFNEIKEGAKYGWPFVYNRSKIYPHGQVPPQFGLTKEDWARQSVEPLLMYRAHSAPLQLAFYTGSQFPAEYKNDAFATMRGSWNRKPASGYEVVRVHFGSDGTPQSITPFLTGFLVPNGKDGKDGQFGRPVGAATLPDGSLLIGDDTNNTIYRVRYQETGQETRRDPLLQREISTKLLKTQNAIKVQSASFTDGGKIPDTHTSYGAGKSPQISWSGAPAGTKSFVLMLEDPDALSPKPFVHWLAANIPAETTTLPEGLPKGDMLPNIGSAMQGAANTGKVGYYGPQPPPEDPEHHYHFQIFALDTMLDIKPGFTRHAVLKAMQGHILSTGDLVGTYKR